MESEAPKKRGRPPNAKIDPPSNSAGMAQGFINRMADILREKQDLTAALNDVKASAKGQGFNPKVLQKLAARDLETSDETAAREAEEQELHMMEIALGQLNDTPLGQYATA